MRGRLKSPPSAVTMKTTSTFAASSCGSGVPDALRINALVRGKTTSIVDGLSPSDKFTATKSPTPGKSDRCATVLRMRPVVPAESSVASVATR